MFESSKPGSTDIVVDISTMERPCHPKVQDWQFDVCLPTREQLARVLNRRRGALRHEPLQ
jgi:hypothetical protein